MKVSKNIFWGIICMLAAVALVVNKLGYLQGMGFWSILFSIILAGICIRGILKKKWGQILFSAAFFIIINDQLLHLESLTPWTILGVALLGTISLNLLFPSKKNRQNKTLHTSNKYTNDLEKNNELMIAEDGEHIHQDVVFGNSMKYIKSQDLSKVTSDCVFGQISIYLTETKLKNHQAKILMDVVFGNAHIYVPADWVVLTNVDTVFGDVSFHGAGSTNGEDTLLINGDVVFGELNIHYV